MSFAFSKKRFRALKYLYKISSDIISFPKFSFISTSPIEAADYAFAESRKFEYGRINEDDERVYDELVKYWLYTHFNTSNLKRRPKKLSEEDRLKLWGHTGNVTANDLAREEIFDAITSDIESGGNTATGAWFRKNKEGKGVPNWNSDTAWSAAFVTYVMSRVDGPAIWPKSESHSVYRSSAKKDRIKVEKNPEKYYGKQLYLLFSQDELKRFGGKIERGDVVGTGHMDIVVNDSPYMVIGGNTISNVYEENLCDGCTAGVHYMKPHKWVIKRVKIVPSPTKSKAA